MWLNIKNYFINNYQFLIKLALIVILGYIAIKFIVGIVRKIFSKTKMEKSAAGFLSQVIRWTLAIIYLIIVLTTLGVPTTSFVAVLTAFSLAISLALQDTFSNLASGIQIIVNKPFKTGDFIQIGGVSGSVTDVKIVATTLTTPDNKLITIPNKTVASSEIINFSTMPYRRVDMVFSVSYGSDIDKVKGVIISTLENEKMVIFDKGITVRLVEQGKSSLNFTARVWVKNEDYWPTFFNLNEDVLKAFSEANIEVPFNQLDVNIKK